MGKKQRNLSGISQFVLQAFDPPSVIPSPLKTEETSPGRSHPLDPTSAAAPPNKKIKTGRLGTGHEAYDATGLVPYYTDASHVPDNLQKYFSQRTRFFSLYDSGCLLDEEGWYSVTPEAVADQIAERCRCTTILDAFCGVGGNAIAFARTCERVIALDTSPTRLALARHNATIYGVADRIEFILTDYLSFARSLAHTSTSSSPRKIDIVFLSPPWGGPSYLSGNDVPNSDPQITTWDENNAEAHPEFSLASVQPVHGKELFDITRRITPNVAYYLPRNTRLQEISALLDSADDAGPADADGEGKGQSRKRKRDSEESSERCEIEEEWMGNKLKALTCYFGGLVEGQEHIF